MEYKIYVEKRERNENYNKEYEEWQKKSYYQQASQPQEFVTHRILEVCLTEEEFKRAKSEIIKNFD